MLFTISKYLLEVSKCYLLMLFITSMQSKCPFITSMQRNDILLQVCREMTFYYKYAEK